MLGLALDSVSSGLRVFPLTVRVVNAWFSPLPFAVEGPCFGPWGDILCSVGLQRNQGGCAGHKGVRRMSLNLNIIEK